MKKAILTALATVLFLQTFSAFGQEAGWDIEAGLCYSVTARSLVVRSDSRVVKNSDIVLADTETHYSVDGRDVYYENHPILLPTLAITAGRHLDGLPVNLRIGLYMNHAYNTLYGGPSPLRERETLVNLLPELRCYYLEKPLFRVFADAGAGLCTSFYSETLDGDTVGSAKFTFSWQISPIGMEIGSRWYFAFAFGVGRLWDFGIINVGYRFGKSPR